MNFILGIDIGTGSTKAIAVAEGGEVIATAQGHYDIQSLIPGYSEQDPELIWQQFIKCVSEVCAKLDEPPVALSLSSAFHSLIGVDEEGNALSPMMTWADTRAADLARKLRSSALGESIYSATGTPIHPMSPLCKLMWLREHDPALCNRTHKFISIKEYIWFKLFGVFEVDHSIASATGLFDILSLKWNADALTLAGIDITHLSTPVSTTYRRSDIRQQIANKLNLPAGIPVIAGLGDGCAANLGSNVTGSSTAALTIGTSGAVRITRSAPVHNYNAMIFNYLLDERTYVSGGAVNNGGNAVNWLLDHFLNKDSVGPADYEQLFADIETIPAGSDGLLFLPYLHGERAPIWDAEASASFLNVKAMHTQQHFLRAGIEGICYALNDVLKQLEASSGTTIEQLNISGGFISSPTWVQLLADVTGKKLVIVQDDDASAMGAIYIAARALYGSHEGFRAGTGDTSVIMPGTQTHQLYKRDFERYSKASRLLTDIYRS